MSAEQRLIHLPIDLRGHAGDALEHPAEIIHIRNATLQGNVLDGQICGVEQDLMVTPLMRSLSSWGITPLRSPWTYTAE